MVRIASRKWTPAQIEQLKSLAAAGSSAASAAIILRRSVTVVQIKARKLGTPFQTFATFKTTRLISNGSTITGNTNT